MTETGFASAARGRNGSAALFSPGGCAAIPREAKKRGAAVLQQACGPSAAAAAAPVMSQAIEAVMVMVSKTERQYHGYHRHLQENRQRRICRRHRHAQRSGQRGTHRPRRKSPQRSEEHTTELQSLM